MKEDLNLLVYLGLFFLISQLFGKAANWMKTPRLVGYLISGILFGPYVLNVFSRELIFQMDLFTQMALAIIAFSIGASLKINTIKEKKKVILGISVLQAVICAAIVAGSLFAALYFLYPVGDVSHILGISLIVGAVSAATAPAAILSLVHEYKAKGNMTTVLMGIIALDDAIVLIFYAFAFSIAQVLISGAAFSFQSGIIEPLLSVIYAVALGVGSGILIKAILGFFPSQEVLLGLMLGAVFFIAGLAQTFGLSHLLPIMVFAFYIENFSQTNLAKKAYESVEEIEEPILGVFFLLAGAHLNLSQAVSAGLLVGIVFLARSAGKYFGTRVAGKITHAEDKVSKYLGLALLPSAGVAIGLVLDAQARLSDALPELTTLMLGIIIGQTLINELISPFLVRYALRKSGDITS